MQQSQPSQEARLHFLDYWRVIKTRKAVVFVVFLLVVLVAATVTYFQPKIYAGDTRIKVEQERPSVEVFQQQAVPAYDPYFLQTQYEIIQSQKTLYPVIERLNLIKRWEELRHPLPIPTMEFALQRLKNQLAVRRYRDTSLIEIVVTEEDPNLAADISNTIADEFEKERLDVKRQQVLKGIDKIRDELAQQLARLQAAQQKVETLRKELDVPVIGTAENSIKLSDQTLQQLQSQLTDARVQSVTHEVRLQELKKLTPLQLRNEIATSISDPSVQQLLNSLTDAETALERLKEDYGPDHPTVRAMLATRDKLQEQLDGRLEGVIHGYQVEYEMNQARAQELQRRLDEAKNASLALDSDKYLPFRNAQRDAELQSRLYDALKMRLQQESIEVEVPRSPVEVVDRAQPSQIPVRPNMWLNVSIGAVVGLVLGIGLTFLLEILDTSIKRMEDVERHLGLPVLGVVARQAQLLSRGDASPSDIEAYRMLRTNIEFAKGDGAGKSLCILSAGAGEGKSFTIANLACTYAQHGERVLVVDSDLRRPGIHEYMGVPNTVGLADYLAGTKTVDEIIQPTGVPNVSVITSGIGASAALPMLASQRMEQLMQNVSQRFDVVLYDTPPVLGVSDAAVMAREVGTAILVIQHRRYPRAMSLRARQVIENAGGKLLGVVVNNVNIGQDETYYYYHDHYERHLPARDGEPPSAPATAKKAADDEIELQSKY
ncbi:MAG TPA: polysaccharide biosynthesis tyrosine autokinase [Verrucomicrobiae bacterium]|nr:polysaccharide biosynthesis tyrosine autokinase [Verrucomicrobiae bacterium]